MTSVCSVCRISVGATGSCDCGRTYRHGEHLVMELFLGRIVVPSDEDIEKDWEKRKQLPGFPQDFDTPPMKAKFVLMIASNLTRDLRHDHLTYVYWPNSKTVWRIEGPYGSFGTGWVNVTSYMTWADEIEDRARLISVAEIMD